MFDISNELSTLKIRNYLFYIKLRIFFFSNGNILATNHIFHLNNKKLKLLKHSYPEQRGMGFRKRFFYWNMGLGFDM